MNETSLPNQIYFVLKQQLHAADLSFLITYGLMRAPISGLFKE